MTEPDYNEALIRAFMEYSKWSTKFEIFGYKESAVKARVALVKIRDLAQARYRQIHRTKLSRHSDQDQGTDEASDDN